jgi:hypothetical protein|tara:strand:+ start:2812 stop:3003 length:192 start_codon:yes stop_codon:yes gene_type:complete
MADIDNNGLNQYGLPIDNLNNNIRDKDITFINAVYKYVSDDATRKNLINYYFGEQDDNNFGDC